MQSPTLFRDDLADDSMFDPELLSPPCSTHDGNQRPFKPLDSDNVSLSMTKHRRRLNRAHASNSEEDHEMSAEDETHHYHPTGDSLFQADDFQRWRLSLPMVSTDECDWMDQKLHRSKTSSDIPSGLNPAEFQTPSSLEKFGRRWSVLSKAGPTFTVCDAKHTPFLTKFASEATHTENKATEPSNTDLDSSTTPAMITLRRATSKRPRARPNQATGITFFPQLHEPGMSIKLLSFFRANLAIDTSAGLISSTESLFSQASRSWLSKPPQRRASVIANAALPCSSILAEPAFTEITEFPQLDTKSQEMKWSTSRRRSTRVFSGDSIHEIIWDDDLSSNERQIPRTQNPSRASQDSSSKDSPAESRRRSSALEMLESQIRRSHQYSQTKRASSNPRKLSGVSEHGEGGRHKFFQGLLNSNLVSAESNFPELKHLPKSRASLRPQFAEQWNLINGKRVRDTGKCSVDELDFPRKLQDRAWSIMEKDQISPLTEHHEDIFFLHVDDKPADTLCNPLRESSHQHSSMNTNIGSSSHIRRNISRPFVSKNYD